MLHKTNSLRQMLINGSKKLAFVLAMFLTVGISSSFATPVDNMSAQVKASYRKDFSKAELMNEEVTKQYTKLTLKMNDMVLYAFYSDNGDLLAVTRNIRTSQLPIKLLLQLKKGYNDYWISELFEMNADGQNSYYVKVENADTKVILRSADTSDWELYERSNKK
jgi:hypothetical protein